MHYKSLPARLGGKAARVAMAGTLALALAPALPAMAAETAPANGSGAANATDAAAQVTIWKDLYKGLGVDTSTGYDAVTSATNFTSRHAKDLPTIVHRVTNESGATTSLDGTTGTNTSSEGLVQVKLQKAEYRGTPSSHYTREFAIYPDDTVPGYVWNDYKNSVYAVTVSDGTTTAGAVPWIDYYGEDSTSGYHYNMLEVALENGLSKESNAQTVTRFAKFFDGNGNLKGGTYTITAYAKGYSDLTATVKVKPAYAGAEATDSSKAANALAISGLPSDIKDAQATVSYVTGQGRNAVTTYLAGGEEGGAAINADGTVSLDAEKLAALESDTKLDVRIDSSNYEPATLGSKVADAATFPNKMSATAKAKTVKAKKLAKKKQTVAAITVSNPAKSKLSYKKASGSKNLSVNAKNGKIVVKKGTKKGTYKAKVRVSVAAGNSFAAASKTVSVTVKVK